MKKTLLAIISMLLCVGQSNIVDAQTFSVSPDKKVYFSPGNLQWSATGGGNTATTHVSATGTAAGTWRFAENQYDYIGSSNSYISSYYSGWIDLFGWGTSGYESNGYGSKPYTSAIDPHTYTLPYNIIDMSLTNHEWGTYNAIYNPKTGTTDAPGTWRSLTKDEWEYLFKTRPDAVSKYGIACVNGVNGMIILPDSWTLPTGLSFYPNIASNDGSQYYAERNYYTLSQWQRMEEAGAVFLPAAGFRDNGEALYVGSHGAYWSSTFYNPSGDVYGREQSTRAYCLFFGSSTLGPSATNYVNCGFSIRLVRDISGVASEAETVQAENGAPELIYEFAISGHPKYVKAYLYEKYNEEEVGNAIVEFYDRDGKSVKRLVGDGSWSAQGFIATFEDGNIEIGVMGMGVGPYFSEKGKEYRIRIVSER